MLEGLKETIEFLIDKGQDEQVIEEINGQMYTNINLSRIKELSPEALKATTLTALVDYIKSGYDQKASEKLIIHVISPKSVALYSELKSDKTRENYLICEALLPRIEFGRYLDIEDFNIMLQSTFIRSDEAAGVLQIVGNVKETTDLNSVDDGVSQTVIMQTGISTQGRAVLPEQVELAPYRTFPEIKQPSSKFILRLRKGPEAALFEADGGAWRNKAMENIKDFLKDQLADIDNIEIIS